MSDYIFLFFNINHTNSSLAKYFNEDGEKNTGERLLERNRTEMMLYSLCFVKKYIDVFNNVYF